MKKWKQHVMSLAVVLGIGSVFLPAMPVAAVDVYKQCGASGDSAICKAADSDDLGGMVKIVINTVLVVLGMIAVIMVVVGGVRYTTSNGDSGAIKTAKDTILYAVIGLVVAIMAFSIVNFVVGRF